MIYSYECVSCGEIFERFKSVQDRHNVFHCDRRAIKLLPTKLSLYEEWFEQPMEVAGKQVQITSKKQYRNLLKQNGIVESSTQECRQEAKIKKRYRKEREVKRRNEGIDKITTKVNQEGLGKHLAPALKTLASKAR